MNPTAPKLVTTTGRHRGFTWSGAVPRQGRCGSLFVESSGLHHVPPITVGVGLLRRLLTSARSPRALPHGALPRLRGRVRWVFQPFQDGPQSGSHGSPRPQAGQISPNKNMNCPCTSAAFTLSPVPGGLRREVPTRPGTEPSMRFLSVASHVCSRASFRHPLAGLPLPSASGFICPIGHSRDSHRGLPPHKFMPMSGVHPSMHRTRYSGLRPLPRAGDL
jgi:hypothetical protein